MLLSFILSGNHPVYKGGCPNPILDNILSHAPFLLTAPEDRILEYMLDGLDEGARALPYNRFLDILNHPDGQNLAQDPCIEWIHDSSLAIPHVVVGDLPSAGGQWATAESESPIKAETLSYAELLSLPGYTFSDHYRQTKGQTLPPLIRPSRAVVMEYYATYPSMVGIDTSSFNSRRVLDVSWSGGTRPESTFTVEVSGSSPVRCRNVVLASGVFSHQIRPTESALVQLSNQIMTRPPTPTATAPTILIIGSGYSAADAILATPPGHKIVHIYRWRPEIKKSPLSACHQDAYPDYAGIYRLMSLEATGVKKRLPDEFHKLRDWGADYKGLPNAKVIGAGSDRSVQVQTATGEVVRISEIVKLEYHIGRYGSLEYLSQPLADALFPVLIQSSSGAEEKIGTNGGPEVHQNRTQPIFFADLLAAQSKGCRFDPIPNLYVVGSLAGDTLVRYCYGTVVQAASRIVADQFEDLETKYAALGERTVTKEKSRISHRTKCFDTVGSTIVSAFHHPPSSVHM